MKTRETRVKQWNKTLLTGERMDYKQTDKSTPVYRVCKHVEKKGEAKNLLRG